jgi:hypothetical protein
LTEFTHGIASRWDTENIVNKPFNELLADIFTGEISIGELARSEKLLEGNSLSCKGDHFLLFDGHAGVTPELEGTMKILKKLYWRSGMPSSVQKIQGGLSRKTNPTRGIRLYFWR